MTHNNLFKILFVEDLPSDVDLAVLELQKEKLQFEHATVCTRVDLIVALKKFKPDLIISDYMMPSYNGLQALRDVKEFDESIPFILHTGAINEETAVECLKAGADDYIIKEHMTRLPFAVKEALENISIRKEKRASELLLKDSEEKLQSIFSTAPIGIGLLVNRMFIEVNDAFCEMTGYSRKELIGTDGKVIFPTIDEYELISTETNSQIGKKGSSLALETRFRSKSGSILNILLNTAPLDENDFSRGFTFTALNITNRKQVEVALRQSEERFRTLYNDAEVGLYRTNSQGEILMANKALVKMLHFQSFEELSARNLRETGYAPSYQRQQFVDQIEKEGEIKNLESIWICRDGKEIFVNENAKAIYDTEGKIIYYDGTVEDITDRKKAEKALQESEEKFRSAMENSADAIFICDLQGRFIYTNKAVTTMLGFTSEEMKSKTIIDLVPHNKTVGFSDIFRQVLSEGKLFTEIELLKKDGNFISTDLNSVLLPGDLVYGSCRDITERKLVETTLKHAKEKAEASDKLKTAFLNNISHEVRTPLNGILGFAEIMSQDDLSEEEKKESVSMLLLSSDRLLNTISNYMDISLITSGNMSVHKKVFIPGKELRKIFDDYNPICSNRKLELFLEVLEKTGSVSIISDPDIFQKIISHLLDNAIKFTEKGSIHYGCIMHEAELEFFVKDTGIGIGKESVDNIFDPFMKEDRGPNVLSDGSGLGLSIAKGMTDIIGGNIQVESEVGVGSSFSFTLPLIDNTDITTSGSSGKVYKKIKGGDSILVAEDDETNFFFLRSLLTRETGAKILHACNGREAIEIFNANPDIILILMDIKMPEIDGLEATRQIKLIKPEIPVIAITAYAMSGDEERVLAAGCDGYLSKPISKKSLLGKMAEFIKI